MGAGSRSVGSFDWVMMLLYFALVGMGWVNIYSAAYDVEQTVFFDTNNVAAKQLVWIILSIVIITFILFLEAKLFERFSSII